MPARRFEAKETTVYRDLQNSMKRLGATSLRVKERDLLDAKDVKAEIIFDRAGKRYVVRCAKWPNFLDNLRAAERTIFYLYRAIAEYGAETNEKAFAEAVDQFFAGFEALPDDTVLMLGSGKRAWWEVLGVPREATKTEIISAFRALARVHHPDAGGDAETFKRLRDAYETALGSVDGVAAGAAASRAR
jgi:DnaJ-domain-containing protein 1